jgi:lecithin-cholesterol acyltransferase
MLRYFEDQGYAMRQNLFPAPYDWRLAPVGIDPWYSSFKDLVEKAYIMNNQTKVTIVGYSAGGFNLEIFLTEKVDASWKNEYIEKVIFLAPSFGGTHMVFDALFQRYSPVIPFMHTETMARLVEGLPSLQAHLLNHEVFGNQPVVAGPQGELYTARELPDLLTGQQRITKPSLPLFNKSISVTKKAPKEIGLPTMIIYNSGLPTPALYNFSRGWHLPPSIVNGPGDGTIPAAGPQWACDHWDHSKSPLVCIDVGHPHQDFGHYPMTYNHFVHELLYNSTLVNEWAMRKNGKTVVKAPFVECGKNKTFVLRQDLRELSTATSL